MLAACGGKSAPISQPPLCAEDLDAAVAPDAEIVSADGIRVALQSQTAVEASCWVVQVTFSAAANACQEYTSVVVGKPPSYQMHTLQISWAFPRTGTFIVRRRFLDDGLTATAALCNQCSDDYAYPNNCTQATAGTVTVTRFDHYEHVSGTYDLRFGPTEVAGTFDTDFCNLGPTDASACAGLDGGEPD